MTSKIQVVLHRQDEWAFYVIQEDGKLMADRGPFATEEECREAASAEFPDLEFVRSVPQEVWPPAA